MTNQPMKPDTTKNDQARPERTGADDPRSSDPSRQASRQEPSHQKDDRTEKRTPDANKK